MLKYRIESYDGGWHTLCSVHPQEPLDDAGVVRLLIAYANKKKRPVRLIARDGVPTNMDRPFNYTGLGTEDIPKGWYLRGVQYPHKVPGWAKGIDTPI